MKWNPAPPEAVSAFAAATKDIDGLERRKMFGYDAVFAHNRMVAGLHEVGMVLRLPDEDRERFVAEHRVEAVRRDGPGDAGVRGRTRIALCRHQGSLAMGAPRPRLRLVAALEVEVATEREEEGNREDEARGA